MMNSFAVWLLTVALIGSSQLYKCQTEEELIEEVVAAIENDDSETVRGLIDGDLNPNARYNDSSVNGGDADNTLLHWAARHDSPDTAEVLIELGADVEAKNYFGNTALHYCGIFGSTAVAKVLIENGANVNAVGHMRVRPLHYAAREGNSEIAQLLIDNGAEVDILDDLGETPLHEATWNGQVEFVQV